MTKNQVISLLIEKDELFAALMGQRIPEIEAEWKEKDKLSEKEKAQIRGRVA